MSQLMQLDQIIVDKTLEGIGSRYRQDLGFVIDLLDNKMIYPSKVELIENTSILKINPSPIRRSYADSVSSVSPYIYESIPPINGMYHTYPLSYLNLFTGSVTGAIDLSFVPVTSIGKFRWATVYADSVSAMFGIVFGEEQETKPSYGESMPSISPSTFPLTSILLESTSGGMWNYANPLFEDIYSYVRGGGGATSLGDITNVITNPNGQFSLDGWQTYSNTTPSNEPDDFGGASPSFEMFRSNNVWGSYGIKVESPDIGEFGCGVFFEFTEKFEDGVSSITYDSLEISEIPWATTEVQIKPFLMRLFNGNWEKIDLQSDDFFNKQWNDFDWSNAHIAKIKRLNFVTPKQLLTDNGEITFRLCFHVTEAMAIPSEWGFRAVSVKFNDSDSDHRFQNITHGTSGYVLGQYNYQDVLNKNIILSTVSGCSIFDPEDSVVKRGTYAELSIYAPTARNGSKCFATDLKVYYNIVDSILVPESGGTGSIITQEEFNITAPQESFELTNISPLPNSLKCYHVQLGQVYVVGVSGLSVSGSTITFPSGSFDFVTEDEPATLVFEQVGMAVNRIVH